MPDTPIPDDYPKAGPIATMVGLTAAVTIVIALIIAVLEMTGVMG